MDLKVLIGMCFHLLPYVVYGSREGSGETERMQRFVSALFDRLCAKYWPKCVYA